MLDLQIDHGCARFIFIFFLHFFMFNILSYIAYLHRNISKKGEMHDYRNIDSLCNIRSDREKLNIRDIIFPLFINGVINLLREKTRSPGANSDPARRRVVTFDNRRARERERLACLFSFERSRAFTASR